MGQDDVARTGVRGARAGTRVQGHGSGSRLGAVGRSLAGTLSLALLASGCSLWPLDQPRAEAVEGMQWLTADECAALSLDRAGSVPLDPVAIQGWPFPDEGDHGVVVASITDPHATGDDEDDTAVLLVPDWLDPVALPTPVHPSGDLAGGSIQVRIGQREGDDERWCDETLDLQIEPLPTAESGEGIAVQVEHVDGLLDRLLAPHGMSAAELAATDRAAIAPDLLPLHIPAVLLHHDDGLYASVAELTPEERDLADRLLAQVQRHASEVPETVRDGEVAYLPTGTTARSAPRSSRGMPRHHPEAGAVRSLRAAVSGLQHGDAADQIGGWTQQVTDGAACTETDLAGLADLLGKQFSGAAMSGGAPAMAIEGAMQVGGLPIIGRVALPTVLTAWVTKFVAQYLDAMLPSTLVRTGLDHAPIELWEDDVAGGHVDGFTMRFSSDGWDAGPLLAELAIILAGTVSTGVLTRHLKKPRRGDPGVIEFWGELVYESLEAMDTAAAEAELIAEVVAWIVGDVISDVVDVTGIAADNLTFAPQCWTASSERPDLDDTLRLHYLGAIERGSVDEHYVAASIGTGRTEARWELPVGASILGVNLSSEVRKARATLAANGEVEVRPLTITWDPPNQQVRPGDLVTLNVVVSNANDGRIRITDSLGQVDRIMDASDGGVLLYQVPDDWDEAAPIAVTAVSLADRGLRDPRHPGYRGEIDATAFLRPDRLDLYLDPAVSCLDPDETIDLRVVDDSLTGHDVEVVWETDRGRVSSDGRFTAPSQPGSVTLTATAAEDDAATASWTITVGECDQCSFEVTIDGLLGDQARFVTSEAGRFGHVMSLSDVDWNTGGFRGLWVGTADGPVALGDADGRISADPTRTLAVADAPIDVISRFGGRFRPDERTHSYRELHRRGGSPPLAGWDPPTVTGRFTSELVTVPEFRTPSYLIPERPMLVLSGEVTGPIVVGRTVTSFTGDTPAMSAEWIGEPILGSFTLRFEATFHPPFRDRINPDHEIRRPGEARSLEEKLAQPVSIRDYDLDGDHGWCGGPLSDSHERPFTDDAGGGDGPLPTLPELPPRP